MFLGYFGSRNRLEPVTKRYLENSLRYDYTSSMYQTSSLHTSLTIHLCLSQSRIPFRVPCAHTIQYFQDFLHRSFISFLISTLKMRKSILSLYIGLWCYPDWSRWCLWQVLTLRYAFDGLEPSGSGWNISKLRNACKGNDYPSDI